jgi:TRAP-type mannitol/chloroaromatic compound transport system permease small subunit
MQKLLSYIDAIGKWSGKVLPWLSLLLSGVVIFEVISRYVFNSPTIWAFDVAMMLCSAFFLLGCGYILQENAHIRVDVLYNLFPAKVRKALDILFYVVFFFPLAFTMIWYGTKAAYLSWVAEEISNTSQWGELIFWWKGLLPLAFLLLAIQGVAEFIRLLVPSARKTIGEAEK